MNDALKEYDRIAGEYRAAIFAMKEAAAKVNAIAPRFAKWWEGNLFQSGTHPDTRELPSGAEIQGLYQSVLTARQDLQRAYKQLGDCNQNHVVKDAIEKEAMGK